MAKQTVTAVAILALATAAGAYGQPIGKAGSSHQQRPAETNWTCDCPGRRQKQFLPADFDHARAWAQGINCSAHSHCPGGRACRKEVSITTHKAFIAARVDCSCDQG
jgi:hypothetical protein